MSNHENRPLVVGYDGSPSSTAALDWALDESSRRKLAVLVVVAEELPQSSAMGMAYASDWPHDLAVELTARAREHVTARAPRVALTVTSEIGSPAGVLVAASRGAAMVVVGREHHSVVGEAIAGSTSVQVAAHSHCPVVVVEATDAASSAGAVVVGVDGRASHENVVQFAFEEASLRGTSLVAVHAWWYGTPDLDAGWMLDDDTQGVVSDERAAVLSDAVKGWSEKYPEVAVRTVLTQMRPDLALLAEAATASLIVVGSRGHGGFVGLLLGSVSQELLHHPRPCPLMIVHAEA